MQANAIWSVLESFSSPLFSLLLIPILTHSLGLEKYGLYVMVTAFVGLLSFTGLGMNTAIVYYLAVNKGAHNVNDIAERLGTAILITLLGTVTASILIFSGLNLFKGKIQEIFPQLITDKYLIYGGLLILIFNQCDMVISAAMKGMQKFKKSSQLEFLIRLLGFILMALASIILKNVMAIILLSVIIAFLGMLLRFFALSKLTNLNLGDIKLNKKYAWEFFYFGKWMTLQVISGSIFGSLDKLMLGMSFNTTIVGAYNIIVSFTQLSHYVLASACSFILPKISASSASLEILRKNYYRSLVVSAVVSILIMFLLVLFYPYIKVHFDLTDIKYEYFILLISYGVLALCVPPYYFILGFGRVRLLSTLNTISAVVGIVAILFLINRYGILGAVLSRTAYTIIVTLTLFIPPLLIKNLEIKNKNENSKIF